MKVRQELLKYISPSEPVEVRLSIARRDRSWGLSVGDAGTVLFILGFDKDSSIAQAARKSLEAYPAHGLIAALDEKLDPLVIKKVLEIKQEDEAIQIMAALNPNTDDDTLRRLAETGPEEVVAALSDDKELLARKPYLADALMKNPLTGKTIAATLLQGGGPAPAAKPGPKKDEPQPLHQDLTDEKRAKADEQNIFKLVSQMSMGQKLKLALSGNKAARELLVRDSNKMIAMGVLKNPRITEEEVQRVTLSKGSSDEILRHIARNKEWMKSYSIRIGVLTNPKTPLTVSLKLLEYVYEKDIQGISKSKSIPSALASAARRRLEEKGKR